MGLDASRLLAAVHKRLGTAATYRPPDGGPSDALACSAIVDKPDETADLGPQSFVATKTSIEVQVSEIPAPVKGGTFAVAGKYFRIAAAPKRLDPDGLVWTCICDAVAGP